MLRRFVTMPAAVGVERKSRRVRPAVEIAVTASTLLRLAGCPVRAANRPR